MRSPAPPLTDSKVFLTFFLITMDCDCYLKFKFIGCEKGFLLCRGFFFIRPHIQQCAIVILSDPLVMVWRFSNTHQYGGA